MSALDSMIDARAERIGARPSSIGRSLRARARDHLAAELRDAIGLSPCPAASEYSTERLRTARGRSAKVTFGAAAPLYVLTSKGLTTMRVRYALVAADQVVASHDPDTFQPSRGYPAELQERDYTSDKGEQLKVRSQESGFEAALVVNSNPDATNGPPIVDRKLRVLGGNSRAMTIQRIIRHTPQRYSTPLAAALRSHCAALGLDGVGGKELAGAMLVRVLDDQHGTDPTTISALLNRTLTQSMQRAAQSVSLGARLPDDLVELLAGELEEHATLAEVIARNEAKVIASLRRADVITTRNQALYVKERRGKPSLTRAGRDLVVDSILGAVVGDKELLAKLEGRTVVALERAAPVLLAIQRVEGSRRLGYDLVPDLRAALRAWAPIQGIGQADWASYWGNATMFDAGGAPDIEPGAAIVLAWWWARHRKPAQLTRALLEYFRAIPEQFRGAATLFALSEEEVRAQGLDGDGLRSSVLGMAPTSSIGVPADFLARASAP